MKKRTKVLLLLLSAVLLVAASVFGTLAYLTSQGSVNNTFTVGKVGIKLEETLVTEYGVAKEPRTMTSSNAYKLIPGHTYKKDPTITVSADSEDCYIFVKIENGLGNDGTIIYNQNKQINWAEQTDWQAITGYSGQVWAYNGELSTNGIVPAGTVIKVFDAFKFGEQANPENYGSSTIKVTAYAIQADGFEDKGFAAIWEELK